MAVKIGEQVVSVLGSIGVVTGKLSNGDAIVFWGEGSTKRIKDDCLVVVGKSPVQWVGHSESRCSCEMCCRTIFEGTDVVLVFDNPVCTACAYLLKGILNDVCG